MHNYLQIEIKEFQIIFRTGEVMKAIVNKKKIENLLNVEA
jgi:hypothetical protein